MVKVIKWGMLFRACVYFAARHMGQRVKFSLCLTKYDALKM
jgi:hypothetical protein